MAGLVSRMPEAFDRVLVRVVRNHRESRLLRRWFAARHGIIVGEQTFGAFDRWRMSSFTHIGRYCSIAPTARIIDANHPMDALSTHPCFYLRSWGLIGADQVRATPIVVEDDVWMGHNAIVLPGCKRIGRGAVIGAGAVVTADVEPYAIVAGTPARVVRHRFPPDLVAAIERTRWWEHDVPALRAAARAAPEFLLNPSVEGAARFAAALKARP